MGDHITSSAAAPRGQATVQFGPGLIAANNVYSTITFRQSYSPNFNRYTCFGGPKLRNKQYGVMNSAARFTPESVDSNSTVQDAWSNAANAITVNKHLTQDGLRKIIHHERSIELAFEAHRYYDIRRWKLADQYFTTPIKGWSVDEDAEANYYQIRDVGQRSFNSPRDYLQPISFTELSRNPNLVQNPGW